MENYRWVKLREGRPVAVPIEGCFNAAMFIKECKKELEITTPLQYYIDLFLPGNDTPLRPSALVPDQNTAQEAYIIVLRYLFVYHSNQQHFYGHIN